MKKVFHFEMNFGVILLSIYFLICDVNAAEFRQCTVEEFKCESNECIPKDRQCDGTNDCEDATDEKDCSPTRIGCPEDQITCYDGNCIIASNRCDGVQDCAAGEDELDCPTSQGTQTLKVISNVTTCFSNEFQCSDGICIMDSFRCDGMPDCIDESDEENCPPKCSPNDFVCKDGSCVDGASRCDNKVDCRDSSDELDCPKNCRSNEFQCDEWHCVPLSRKCDQILDCRDGSDEFNCPTCNADEFKCDNGHCILSIRQCDGTVDCRDFSDEIGCSPAPTTTTTTTTTPAPRCTVGEFRCQDGHCIPDYRRCDGAPDCTSPPTPKMTTTEDSTASTTTTTTAVATFARRPAVDVTTSQDYFSSTPSPTPPQPSITISIIESDIKIVATGSTVRYDCRATSAKQKVVSFKWSKEGGSLPPARSVDDGTGYFVILSVGASDSGVYVCTAYDGESSVSKKVYLTVGEPAEPKVSLVPSGVVRLNVGDSLSVNCEATGIPPPSVEWGRYDGSPVNRKSAVRSTLFTIGSVRKTDEGTYFCRASNNAGFDEQRITVEVNDLVALKISLVPSGMVQLNVGDSLSVNCQATGIPSPNMEWGRYDGSPINRTSHNGIITFDMTSVRKSDEGTYYCRAANEVGHDERNIVIRVNGNDERHIVTVKTHDGASNREDHFSTNIEEMTVFGILVVCLGIFLYILLFSCFIYFVRRADSTINSYVSNVWQANGNADSDRYTEVTVM